MTWTPIELDKSFNTNKFTVLDLQEVEDFELLPERKLDGTQPDQEDTGVKALALATARLGLTAIPYGSTAYGFHISDQGQPQITRDNRTYTGRVVSLAQPILVCRELGDKLLIHAKIDEKIVFDAKPKYQWN